MYFENKKLVVTYYEAFAGLGATSIALDLVQKMLPQLSFKCVGHCENDPTANRACILDSF